MVLSKMSCVGIDCGGTNLRIYINGVSIPDALYKFGRTAISHEGELDPRLEFNNSGAFAIFVFISIAFGNLYDDVDGFWAIGAGREIVP